MFNKKYTRAFLDTKYEELYKRAKKVMNSLHVCGINKDIFGQTTCAGIEIGCGGSAQKDHLCCHAFGDEPTCQYLRKNGCTVKSLRCALWICSEDIMVPLRSGIRPEIMQSMGPTETHPSRNQRLGIAVFPFITPEHKAIFDEAKKYRFLRFFRQGKTVAVNYAYATQDKIEEDENQCIALTPDEYALVKHPLTGN